MTRQIYVKIKTLLKYPIGQQTDGPNIQTQDKGHLPVQELLKPPLPLLAFKVKREKSSPLNTVYFKLRSIIWLFQNTMSTAEVTQRSMKEGKKNMSHNCKGV